MHRPTKRWDWFITAHPQLLHHDTHTQTTSKPLAQIRGKCAAAHIHADLYAGDVCQRMPGIHYIRLWCLWEWKWQLGKCQNEFKYYSCKMTLYARYWKMRLELQSVLSRGSGCCHCHMTSEWTTLCDQQKNWLCCHFPGILLLRPNMKQLFLGLCHLTLQCYLWDGWPCVIIKAVAFVFSWEKPGQYMRWVTIVNTYPVSKSYIDLMLRLHASLFVVEWIH